MPWAVNGCVRREWTRNDPLNLPAIDRTAFLMFPFKLLFSRSLWHEKHEDERKGRKGAERNILLELSKHSCFFFSLSETSGVVLRLCLLLIPHTNQLEVTRSRTFPEICRNHLHNWICVFASADWCDHVIYLVCRTGKVCWENKCVLGSSFESVLWSCRWFDANSTLRKLKCDFWVDANNFYNYSPICEIVNFELPQVKSTFNLKKKTLRKFRNKKINQFRSFYITKIFRIWTHVSKTPKLLQIISVWNSSAKQSFKASQTSLIYHSNLKLSTKL